MNQGGKHAVEPRLDNKRERERRRGAAGRAAVLRRAPSDSDCSGETASLSADSGDRAPRPVPLAPPRAGKTRSRRRGSEWEVLEGLKDGQRFEKRPDVFNGYLHKKRKWPLKGWHKRFFVVDGGILVYARSPTDVARGRLHGSVDVGLSVISAKARRRRIDIDADEFIYHLRAKTPELFRTWLNVLKAHRLYRQHLLTFGAREAAPKIHPPLEDLPATDNNGHASLSSANSTVTFIENFSPDSSSPIPESPLQIEPSEYNNKDHSAIFEWQQDSLSEASLVPLNFENLEQDLSQCLDENMFDLKLNDSLYRNNSMCSMKCFAKRLDLATIKNERSFSLLDLHMPSTDAEKQMTCTDLDLNQNSKNAKEPSNAIIEKPIRSRKTNSPIDKNVNMTNLIIKSKENVCYQTETLDRKQSPFMDSNHKQETTACYFFTRKKNKPDIANSAMKKSKKCTDLVKYKNVYHEPPLKALTSKCMLLGKYKLVVNDLDDTKAEKRKTSTEPVQADVIRKTVACNVDVVLKENNEVQVVTVQEHKGSQKATTPADYDKIAEKLIVSIFDRCSKGRNQDVKFYIEQVIQDLYDIKVNQEVHPVKALFRNLLEYWLKNTSVSQFKKAMTNEKSVNQSKSNLIKDENLSSFLIKMRSKETQCNGLNEVKPPYICNTNTANIDNSPLLLLPRQKFKEIKYENKYQSPLRRCHSPKRDTASFEKERRIQELERLLKSTVYMCEFGGKSVTKDKDIKITQQLIENIGVQSKDNMPKHVSGEKAILENSGSSAEIPEIQDTINHLLSETAIPPDVAKDFLGVYLDVLMQDSSKSTSTSHSSDGGQSKEIANCEVVGEAIIKKVSKSVTTFNALANAQEIDAPNPDTTTDPAKQVDPGQVYLKDILDKVTTIFSKVKNMEDNTLLENKPKEEPIVVKDNIQKTIKDELGRPVIKSKYDLIYENCDQNSLVIDLSKYNLEHISMFNDPAIKDIMSITIKLKEKPPNHGEEKSTRLSFKFPDDTKPISIASVEKCDNWSHNIFRNLDTNNVTCNFETNTHKNDPKIYFSNISDGTSKACCFRDDSFNSSDVPITTQTSFAKDTLIHKKDIDYLQPSYLMSNKKRILSPKIQTTRNLTNKQCEYLDSTRLADQSPNTSTAVNKTEDLFVFDRSAPKIIDEKFILLLLENLSYVSKNVSSMHKDISTLYVKLKKKYEKYSRNFNSKQGLSLLGKIYSEDTCYKEGDDKRTQCDLYVQEPYKCQETKQASTNTNINRIGERSACTYTHTCMFTHAGAQTDNPTYSVPLKLSSSSHELSFDSKSSRCNMIVTEINTVDINMTEQSTSNPNWFRVATAEAAVNTVGKYFLRDAVKNNAIKAKRPYGLEKQALLKKNFSRVQQALIKEISYLQPSVKVSTQAQTDKQLLRILRDKKDRERDTLIYQLFKSKKCVVTSSSATCSTLDMELSDDIRTLYRCSSYPSICSGLLSPTTPTMRGPQAGFVSGTPGGRFAGWIIESGGPLEVAARELGQAQLSVLQLQRLLDALELQHQHHDTDVSLEGASPNVKKDRRKFGLRKKKSNSKCASVELAPPHIDLSSSHTALSSLSALTAPPSPGGGACTNSAASLPIACAAARPQSLPGADTLNTAQGPASITSLTPDHQLREDFTVLAKDLVASLKGIVSSMVCERGRLRAALEAAEAAATPGGAVMAALRTNLTSALQQNSELRTRLSRIHDASDIAEVMSVANSETARQFQQSLSYSSSCVSASEFFDAEEHEDEDAPGGGDGDGDGIPVDEAGVIELDGDSSSEAGSLSSEEGSASSDNSDGAMLSGEQVTLRAGGARARPASCWARRTRLPAPRPTQGGPSLWNLLYKNIGKDLSQISMPVTINEPLNMLQRLCEELEYSELLDSAASCPSAVERAALVAAFAVSAYAASAHRAASKPFNPLLAETYECVRDDRSFRFLAEQVSHHPPISACHAESPRWCFWQEARIKTKFWGKSMEFQPTGRVHVRLNTTGDHYTWNKVTTCVHNLFGGQRWVDQYGDMHIVCVGTDISCKLNFVKASSWSQTRHEVRGAVTAAGSGARLRLAGRWSEALYAGEPPAARCLWRPGAMPPEHEMYYGFTRFAMELNEIEPGMREILPHTDTRLRPDQRALEEGDVEAAESFKHSLEQTQRERRRESAAHTPAWFRKSHEEGEETWVFSGEYWKAREAGFSEDVAPRIW